MEILLLVGALALLNSRKSTAAAIAASTSQGRLASVGVPLPPQTAAGIGQSASDAKTFAYYLKQLLAGQKQQQSGGSTKGGGSPSSGGGSPGSGSRPKQDPGAQVDDGSNGWQVPQTGFRTPDTGDGVIDQPPAPGSVYQQLGGSAGDPNAGAVSVATNDSIGSAIESGIVPPTLDTSDGSPDYVPSDYVPISSDLTGDPNSGTGFDPGFVDFYISEANAASEATTSSSTGNYGEPGYDSYSGDPV